MKKVFLPVSLFVLAIIFVNCHGPKKAVASVPAAITYEGNVKSIITTNCTPCHIPEKGGKVKAYDNFANVNSDIDNIIYRIQLNPGDRGFMPFKHPKLPDSSIAVFKQWREGGRIEK
jgi:hypothetical protein